MTVSCIIKQNTLNLETETRYIQTTNNVQHFAVAVVFWGKLVLGAVFFGMQKPLSYLSTSNKELFLRCVLYCKQKYMFETEWDSLVHVRQIVRLNYDNMCIYFPLNPCLLLVVSNLSAIKGTCVKTVEDMVPFLSFSNSTHNKLPSSYQNQWKQRKILKQANTFRVP